MLINPFVFNSNNRELSSTFVRLNRMVDNFVDNLNKDIQKLEKDVQLLNEQEEMVNIYKDQLKYLTKDLNNFSEKYL